MNTMASPALNRLARQAPLYDVERVRSDFPALEQTVRGKPLVYLDSAATALKPHSVIDATVNTYARDCANVHRGVHLLSERATQAFESAREKVRAFINAAEAAEVIFVRGTTEAINLVAHSLARPRLRPGDEVLLTTLEHHSNIVPWQMVCEDTGAKLRIAPVTDRGEVELSGFEAELSDRTRIAAFAHASNALGTVLPVRKLADLAHQRGALVVVDGAQGVPHLSVDVQALGCDFYAFSGHKLYGPSGVGVLWGRRELLEEMPPYQGGGDMIRSVTFERTLYNDLPWRFEAGTPNIAGVIGLGAAIDYLAGFDAPSRMQHEQELLRYGTELLSDLPGVRLVGTAPEKIGVLSFVVEGIHPHDVGTVVDSEGVAIRTGHHCTQPLMDRLGIPATARASLGMYNTACDLDALGRAIQKAQKMFSP
ncbi:MAG TPA: cysteine desulfurase [Polyangiaceae bacterium]|jgi:cysteine desulfurase/selenocysteine lyase